LSTALLSDLKLIFKRRTHSEREIRFPFTLVLIRKVNTILDYSSKLISCLWASFEAIGAFQTFFSKNKIFIRKYFFGYQIEFCCWAASMLVTDVGDNFEMLISHSVDKNIIKIYWHAVKCHQHFILVSIIKSPTWQFMIGCWEFQFYGWSTSQLFDHFSVSFSKLPLIFTIFIKHIRNEHIPASSRRLLRL